MRKIVLIFVSLVAVFVAIHFVMADSPSPAKQSIATTLTAKESYPSGDIFLSGILTKVTPIGLATSGQPTLMLEFEDGVIVMCKGGAWVTFRLHAVNNLAIWKTSGEVRNLNYTK